MKTKNSAFFLFLFAITFYTLSCTKTEQLYAVDGVYDISHIDKNTVYSLNGMWGYEEKEFMSPLLPIEAYIRFEPIASS